MLEQYREGLKLNFPLNQQVRIDEIGSGKWSEYSMANNLETITNYIRKRECITTAWWLDSIGTSQIVFRIVEGTIEVLGDNRWVRVGDHWGECFDRLQKRWLKGVMTVDEDEERVVTEWGKGGGQDVGKVAGDCGKVEEPIYTKASVSDPLDDRDPMTILRRIIARNKQA